MGFSQTQQSLVGTIVSLRESLRDLAAPCEILSQSFKILDGSFRDPYKMLAGTLTFHVKEGSAEILLRGMQGLQVLKSRGQVSDAFASNVMNSCAMRFNHFDGK